MNLLVLRERCRLKDPYSGISHWIGAVLAVAGLIFLLAKAQGRPLHLTTFAIYGATLVFLFVSSALFHSVRVNRKLDEALYGLDRAAIYLLIAGTYTPICLVVLKGSWGWSLFGVVWGLALMGIAIDLIMKRRTPDWVQAVLYLITGWLALAAIVPLTQTLSMVALLWLAAGCVIYTLGAALCVKYPAPKPDCFCVHTIWHIMVIIAGACHWVLMFFFVARL